ncbi:MAG: hypothetical protein ABSA97_10500 [Verrucomicrobiia bacterium]
MSAMRVGYYTKRLRKSNQQLEVHFFEPSVLEKYRNDPNYSLRMTRLSTKHGSGVELSALQQYVWGHKPDGSPCVVVLLSHLNALSPADQLHWKLHEIRRSKRKGPKIDRRYYQPMITGRFSDTISIYEAIYLFLREIQKLFQPDVLFPNLPDEEPLFLAPLGYNSRKAMMQFAQDLCTIMQFNMQTLARRITASDVQSKVADCVKREQRRELLRLYFKQHNALSNEIEQALATLKEINELRKLSAHKLTQAERDKNYFEQQADLADRLQCGLRDMMLAFAIAEKGSIGFLSKRVLDYKVVIY